MENGIKLIGKVFLSPSIECFFLLEVRRTKEERKERKREKKKKKKKN